ncbi:hypothetical protein D3C85_1770270 [compost metagenome]
MRDMGIEIHALAMQLFILKVLALFESQFGLGLYSFDIKENKGIDDQQKDQKISDLCRQAQIERWFDLNQ